jgi:uridylate kinase
MGMLATVINGIGLREALVRSGAKETRLMTAFGLHAFAEPYIRLKARHHLDEKRLVIIAGGLGIPNFSTDSAVAQYADELHCDIIFKASTVNGVYDSDPQKNPDAERYDNVTYKEAIEKELGIMDTTAFAMCKRSGIPIFVFDIADLDKLPQIIRGDDSFGTLIHE